MNIKELLIDFVTVFVVTLENIISFCSHFWNSLVMDEGPRAQEKRKIALQGCNFI